MIPETISDFGGNQVWLPIAPKVDATYAHLQPGGTVDRATSTRYADGTGSRPVALPASGRSKASTSPAGMGRAK